MSEFETIYRIHNVHGFLVNAAVWAFAVLAYQNCKRGALLLIASGAALGAILYMVFILARSESVWYVAMALGTLCNSLWLCGSVLLFLELRRLTNQKGDNT